MNVLLDLDGTLTDPRVGIVGCIKHALNSLQLQCPSDAELARYIGPPLQESFRTLLNTTDPVRIDEAVALYRERFTVTGLFENTVYPGIAEALVATAIGLFAAIPAVVAYNRFARDIDRIATQLESFIEEFSNILQRNAAQAPAAAR